MKHLRRAAGVLVALLLITLVLPRLVPPVESIQAYGFYRGGNPAQEWASQPTRFAESATCQSCHQAKFDAWSRTDHKTVICESCHGPAKDHVSGLAKPVVDRSPDQCAVCHQKLASRPPGFPQVEVTKHAGATSCITCHNPHQPALLAKAK